MQKSIVASRNIEIDKTISLKDIDFKSPGGGMKPYEYLSIINKKTKKLILKDQLILKRDLK